MATIQLDKDDLDLLRELVEYFEICGKAYRPACCPAWQPLVSAGMVEPIGDDQGALVPTIAGSVRCRKRAKAEQPEPEDDP